MPAESTMSAVHWRFESLRPSSVTTKPAVKSVFVCDSTCARRARDERAMDRPPASPDNEGPGNEGQVTPWRAGVERTAGAAGLARGAREPTW